MCERESVRERECVKHDELCAEREQLGRKGACGVREGASGVRKVDVRLPGKGKSNSHGASPVYKTHPDNSVDSDQ